MRERVAEQLKGMQTRQAAQVHMHNQLLLPQISATYATRLR